VDAGRVAGVAVRARAAHADAGVGQALAEGVGVDVAVIGIRSAPAGCVTRAYPRSLFLGGIRRDGELDAAHWSLVGTQD